MKHVRLTRILSGVVLSLATAIVFAFTPEAWGANLSWAEVQLVDASGVPNELVHSYTFKGILKLYGTKPKESGVELAVGFVPVYMESGGEKVLYATIWVKGKGKWDEKKNEAEEILVFEGDAGGKFYSQLKCTKDPWIYSTSCTVLNAQYKVTKGKNWDFPGMVNKWRLPISKPAVTLAKAEEISKEHASDSSPPPPPPKVVKKEEPPPTVVGKPSAGAIAAIAKPNLSVTGVQVKIEPNCQAPQPAMTAIVAIKNSGSALPANKGTIFIKEQGGTNLGSAGIPLPAIGAGQTQTVSIPAITSQPYSSLEGSHKVQVILNPQSEAGQLSFNKPADPYVFQATFPSGHCKSAQDQQRRR
jgi:hypothetical protein